MCHQRGRTDAIGVVEKQKTQVKVLHQKSEALIDCSDQTHGLTIAVYSSVDRWINNMQMILKERNSEVSQESLSRCWRLSNGFCRKMRGKRSKNSKKNFQLIHSCVFDPLNAVCKNGDSASSVEKQTRLWLKAERLRPLVCSDAPSSRRASQQKTAECRSDVR